MAIRRDPRNGSPTLEKFAIGGPLATRCGQDLERNRGRIDIVDELSRAELRQPPAAVRNRRPLRSLTS
jgi:hypothetical protein